MMWFETLTGFQEESAQQVRENITLDGEMMTSRVNGRSFACGHLETPSLAELRKRVRAAKLPAGKISLHEVIANVQHLHTNPSNAGSLFQVASQFNLLEMLSPQKTPEHGVGNYEHDLTQGPACAVAAGAGTIYRNYFVPLKEQIGQSADHQIDCLADLGSALGNEDNRLWEMTNGYALASRKGLIEISKKLDSFSKYEIDQLRGKLRIGLQWNTEVTIADSGHTVSQAYCSALPVAYTTHAKNLWAGFARLILEASYEAVICAGILNYHNNGNNKLFLTTLGDGVFGNPKTWIIYAMQRALNKYKNTGLDVAIVSFRDSDDQIQKLVAQY
ncbi:MAG: hypothetical protein IMY76_09035 [Chloroflexi bacterium]|nr:hypothetical protein [Chloroflexota bacterium]